jgi:hypothetical protein
MMSFEEHLLEYGRNMWPKHVVGYADYNVVSLHISVEHAVAQLVKALRHKSEGRGFDSRRCDWNFSLTQSFRPHFGPGVDSASNRNE